MDLSYSVVSLLREQTNTALLRAQAITLNHIIRLNYAAWPKLPFPFWPLASAGMTQAGEAAFQ